MIMEYINKKKSFSLLQIGKLAINIFADLKYKLQSRILLQ